MGVCAMLNVKSSGAGFCTAVAAEIVTLATVTLEQLTAGWAIMNIHLDVVARMPKMAQDKFIGATVRAKTRCMVSRSLRANISMHAKLEKSVAKQGGRKLEFNDRAIEKSL